MKFSRRGSWKPKTVVEKAHLVKYIKRSARYIAVEKLKASTHHFKRQQIYPLVCEVCILFHPCSPCGLLQAQQIYKLPGLLILRWYPFLPLFVMCQVLWEDRDHILFCNSWCKRNVKCSYFNFFLFANNCLWFSCFVMVFRFFYDQMWEPCSKWNGVCIDFCIHRYLVGP